ncbi:helix-turn-helix domain-containing protein [Dorea sp. D27]|uniref:helix-turn-helix domain-containing protein n=1 Tax=Dorea sp. D27 TaxID=658665 RepID=UPI0006A1F98F|nr:helix-turn-helix domain-containing protein [Dorea sp. D27]KMZ52400.1 helix-turn-helix domain-containing protein [Dorea sp. D27]
MKNERIKYIMQQRGLTFEDLAWLSGVPYSTLTKIGSGATENPGFSAMEKIARVLDCSLDEFTDREPDVPYDFSDYVYRFKKLPDPMKEYIKYTIDTEYDQMIHSTSHDKIKMKCFEFTNIVQGLAQYDSRIERDILVSDNEISQYCTFCVYLSTPVLSPKFPEGSLLGFRYDDDYDPKNGEIWIIMRGGYLYMGRVYKRHVDIYIKALNGTIDDWHINSHTQYKRMGRLVGVLREGNVHVGADAR